MDWKKSMLVLIIVVLYVPMVLLGANVFFPDYTGQHAYYGGYGPVPDCTTKFGLPAQTLNASDQAARQEVIDKCYADQRQAQQDFDTKKNAYEGNKYIFVALFNLVILVIALVWTGLNETILIGLFLGPVLTTFFATINYWDTNSKVGFGVLVVTFFVALFAISRLLRSLPRK